MTTALADWRRVAEGFSDRADRVAADGWASPSPCEGWLARDIVAHLVNWVPPFLEAGAGIELAVGPVVGHDPAAAWHDLSDAIETVLADPEVSTIRFEHPVAGRHPLDQAIVMFILGDVLIHTWDLARASGQDETLDTRTVHAQLAGMQLLDEGVLAASGHYKPTVAVPAGADEQTRLLALTGRRA